MILTLGRRLIVDFRPLWTGSQTARHDIPDTVTCMDYIRVTGQDAPLWGFHRSMEQKGGSAKVNNCFVKDVIWYAIWTETQNL